MRKYFVIGTLALFLMAGCRTWILPEDAKWEIVLLTPKVSRGGDLTFRVETIGKDGKALGDISYVWIVDWATTKGSRHKGYSFVENHLRVKGGHGHAELRVYAPNEHDSLVEVARTPFTIE